MNKPLTKKEWEQSVASAWSTAVEATYKDMIAKAVKAEREACAKLCEQEAKELNLEAEYAEDGSYNWKADGALDCAAAIRARGEQMNQ